MVHPGGASKLEPLRPDEDKKGELSEARDDVRSEEELAEELDRGFQSDFPHYTNYLGDLRAMAAARRICKLWHHEDWDIFVLMGKSRDISAEHVLAGDDENNVIFYCSKKSTKRALAARGHEAKKANLEQRFVGERADVFIMLDESSRVTPKLLRHIEPRGWVWSRIETANALRARGSYRFVGAVEKDGSLAFSSRHNDPTFWKSLEVDSDASFREASDPKNAGVITYEKAADMVAQAKKAGVQGMTDNVFESYTLLIEEAEKQNPDRVARGETLLPLTITTGNRDDKNAKSTEITLLINIVRPTKKGEHEDKMIIMRKGPI